MAYSYGALNTVAVEKFSINFDNEYQMVERKLSNVTQEYHNIEGSDYVVKVAKYYDLASRGAYGSDIARQIVQYRKQLVEMKDYTTLVSSDIFEQALVNASEIQNEARQAAWALGRIQDQVILNGMLSSTPDNTVSATSNLNLAALQETKQNLDDQDVPSNGRIYVGTYSQQRSLLGETETTSTDYNTQKTLVLGQIGEFYGFKFIWISDGMSTGGLTKSGGIRKTYAFQMDAIVTPYGIEPSIDRDWDTSSQSYLLVPRVRMGSEVIKTNGIVLVNCTES